ncbi:MAG TPA: hemolysin family protein [Terriglobales bacterium]|nr:hemolysin family protein [Terriglobales bacterium]
MIPAVYSAIGCLCGLLLLVSYVERVYAEMGKFLSREFQENIEVFEKKVEPRLGVSRQRASLSMSVLAQVSTAALGLLSAFVVLHDLESHAREIVSASVGLLLIIAIFNRLLPFILFARTRGEWLVPLAPLLRGLIYLALIITIPIGFGQSVTALSREHAAEEPEHPSEAVDALIEAGQEEGILEESDRALIQSVVEFGDKTVREVMTPRPEITAVAADTTIEQLTELQRRKPYSRVPVYDGNIDHIIGIVLTHDLLQITDSDARTRTVRQMMKPVHFIPETQRVSSLLREMQQANLHMAIVIDEYGSVAGVVTMEDLVEEIVGEIRDEHEPKADIIRESENSYVVPGNMDVDRLQELFNIRPEAHDATTVAGLVSEALGRIPNRGEVVERDDLRFEVLESTGRRVVRLRISSTPQHRQQMRA